MKSQVCILLLLVSAMAVSGCATTSLAASPAASTEPLAVEDQAALISALEGSGAIVEIGEPVSQVFFSAAGNILKVDGADVQVFEYESAEEMENDASRCHRTVVRLEPQWSHGSTCLISIKPDA